MMQHCIKHRKCKGKQHGVPALKGISTQSKVKIRVYREEELLDLLRDSGKKRLNLEGRIRANQGKRGERAFLAPGNGTKLCVCGGTTSDEHAPARL